MRTRELADGSLVAAEAVRHPDPVAEAFRWRACEGELVQIIERARGVNRQSDAERVDVVVLTDVLLPMPVETMVGADDIAPRAEDRMLVEGGVALSDSEDAARAYPNLWRSGNALRVARHRERERYERDWQPPPGLMRACYRRAANGTHHGTAVFDPGMVPDITAWLKSALGDLTEVTSIAPLHSPIRDSSKGDVMKLPAEDAQARVPPWAIDEADAVRARAPARWLTIGRVSTEFSQRDFGS